MSALPRYIDEMARAIRAETPSDLLSDETDLDGLYRCYAAGASKRHAVTASDVHDAWCVWMLNRGEDHESVVPFEALGPQTQAEDEPFPEAIRKAVRRR